MTHGLRFLDHTADVGMAVEADSLAGLYHRSAGGMLMLLRGQEEEQTEDAPQRGAGGPAAPGGADGPGEPGGAGGRATVALELRAETPHRLLADWLRELLFLHGTRHRDYVGATFLRLEPRRLEARVETEPARPAAREIKGVTYHELDVTETAGGWRATVIFDV